MKKLIIACALLFISSPAFSTVTIWGIAGSITVTSPSGGAPIAVPMGTDTSVFSSKDTCDVARKTMLSNIVVKRSATKSNGTVADYSTWLPSENLLITDFTSCVPSIQY